MKKRSRAATHYNIIPVNVFSRECAIKELSDIGVDSCGIDIMSPKMIHLNIKLKNLDSKKANFLKEEMLSIGGEAAIAKDALTLNKGKTDVILIGSLGNFKKFIEKLSSKSSDLNNLGKEIENIISNLDNYNIIKLKNKSLDFRSRTYIMGILNITPDSFYDGGFYMDCDKAIRRAYEMIEAGADMIDIGGESTRPNSDPISEEEEIRRVIPVIKELSKRIKTPISIDTYKASVAKEAIESGAEIINDISAMKFDPDMVKVASHYKVPVVLMHIKGIPKTMQKRIRYKDVLSEIYLYLKERIIFAHEAGIKDVIIDPGIGFGKGLKENLKIINNLNIFKGLGKPILIGPSRKSFIGEILGLEVKDRLEGSMAAVAASVINGANIVRVHDVDETRRVTKVIDSIRRYV
jgi:dihydropteroate synthase